MVNNNSLSKLSELLEQAQGKEIWRIIHPAGGWLFFDIGRRLPDVIYGLKGKTTPYDTGEIRIFIECDWEFWSRGKLIQSRQLRPGETNTEYFDRIEDGLIGQRTFKTISGTDLTGETLSIHFDNGEELRVFLGRPEQSFGVIVRTIDPESKNVSRQTSFYVGKK